MKELSRYRVQNIDHVENTERQKKLVSQKNR